MHIYKLHTGSVVDKTKPKHVIVFKQADYAFWTSSLSYLQI